MGASAKRGSRPPPVCAAIRATTASDRARVSPSDRELQLSLRRAIHLPIRVAGVPPAQVTNYARLHTAVVWVSLIGPVNRCTSGVPSKQSPSFAGSATDVHRFQRIAPNACRSHVENRKNRPEGATELLTELLWKGRSCGRRATLDRESGRPVGLGERDLREFARATRSPRAGRGCGQPEGALRRSRQCPPRLRPRARARRCEVEEFAHLARKLAGLGALDRRVRSAR